MDGETSALKPIRARRAGKCPADMHSVPIRRAFAYTVWLFLPFPAAFWLDFK
jgi:hypothetical protein